MPITVLAGPVADPQLVPDRPDPVRAGPEAGAVLGPLAVDLDVGGEVLAGQDGRVGLDHEERLVH